MILNKVWRDNLSCILFNQLFCRQNPIVLPLKWKWNLFARLADFLHNAICLQTESWNFCKFFNISLQSNQRVNIRRYTHVKSSFSWAICRLALYIPLKAFPNFRRLGYGCSTCKSNLIVWSNTLSYIITSS